MTCGSFNFTGDVEAEISMRYLSVLGHTISQLHPLQNWNFYRISIFMSAMQWLSLQGVYISKYTCRKKLHLAFVSKMCEVSHLENYLFSIFICILLCGRKIFGRDTTFKYLLIIMILKSYCSRRPRLQYQWLLLLCMLHTLSKVLLLWHMIRHECMWEV